MVVEHDVDTIRAASHIIDIGPSAGKRGGRLVAEGTVDDVMQAADSQTGRYLMHAIKHPMQKRRIVAQTAEQHWIEVQGANMHNLQNVNVQIPLQRLVAITGVSGSGKSTLAREVMLTNVHAAVAQKATKAGRDAAATGNHPVWVGCANVSGYETVQDWLYIMMM